MLHHAVVSGHFHWPHLAADETDVRGTRVERADRCRATHQIVLEFHLRMVFAKTPLPVLHRFLDEDVSPGPNGSAHRSLGLIRGKAVEVVGRRAGARRQDRCDQYWMHALEPHLHPPEWFGSGSNAQTSAFRLS